MENFKKQCMEATKFIESCWDENNPNDGLTFDQRLNERKKELPKDIRDIVDSASIYTKSNII